MPFTDPFFRELMLLGSLIKTVRDGKSDSLPRATQFALQKADAILSTRALTCLQDALGKAKQALPEDMAQTETSAEHVADFTAHTTVPQNTSSQPSPSDLAGTQKESAK